MNVKSKGLGRGLDAIFDIEKINITEKKNSGITDLEIEKIIANPNQPRTIFDEEALQELADSIKSLGVIQPITVKKGKDNKYLIISGERRFRASQIAGLKTVPVYIREADDETLLEMSLVENIQRQDLNAMEIALSLQRLVDECELTQESLAGKVGKKRSTVANYLRLLKLPAAVQLALREELISMGHARALISVDSEQRQLNILYKIINQNLSVRQTEELVNKPAEKQKKQSSEEYPLKYIRLVEHLEKFFNQDISIKKGPKGKGKIVIEFKSDKDIEDFIKKFDSITI